MKKFTVETKNEKQIYTAACDAILFTGLVSGMLGLIVGYIIEF